MAGLSRHNVSLCHCGMCNGSGTAFERRQLCKESRLTVVEWGGQPSH